MKKTSLVKVSDEEIRNICRSISTDSTIASYFGCTIERVVKVRAGMSKPRVAKEVEPWVEPSRRGAPKTDAEKAKEASRGLLEALEEAMCKDSRMAGSPGHLMAVAALG